MITRYRMGLAVLTCTAIMTSAFGAFADEAMGAKSPEEIGGQLKSRGIPNLGTIPAEPNPSNTPANVQAVPLVAQPPKPGTVQAVPLVRHTPKPGDRGC
jgi:hypothetical protein